jgi:hypothetical protein
VVFAWLAPFLLFACLFCSGMGWAYMTGYFEPNSGPAHEGKKIAMEAFDKVIIDILFLLCHAFLNRFLEVPRPRPFPAPSAHALAPYIHVQARAGLSRSEITTQLKQVSRWAMEAAAGASSKAMDKVGEGVTNVMEMAEWIGKRIRRFR